MTRGVFITGTDTGVGKTFVACALVHALRAAGERVLPWKPIAAGAAQSNGMWVNEDTAALARAAGLGLEAAARITPVLLREPMAPHVAARREGRTITLAEALAPWRAAADEAYHVVEGVGGFLVPLGDCLDTADLARALGLPVVLVVGLRLGCLNHALLTQRAVQGAGLRLAGWIANALDPAMAVPEENVRALQARIDAPLLGRIPFAPGEEPARLADRIDASLLLRA